MPNINYPLSSKNWYLWNWGQNTVGQLGTNDIVHRSSPVQTVAGGTNWYSIDNLLNSSATIKTDGTLWLWGRNDFGQLGDNTITWKSSPVQTVSGGNNWLQISGGRGFVASIKTDGTLWTWGENSYGQLGTNDIIHRSSPIQTVTGGTTWQSVASGTNHVASIKTDGTLWTWGINTWGQLGTNDIIHRSSPVQTISAGTNWIQVASGTNHVYAIKSDNTLWVWGRNNLGQLGTNDAIHRSSPIQTVSAGTNWKFVNSGRYHTSAIKTDNTLWLWGQNDQGQLGVNDITHRSSPIQTVAGGSNWKSFKSGAFHTAAVKADGTLWTWGSNSYGQLGTNDIVNRSSPIQTIAGGNKWVSVTAGGSFTTALAKDPTSTGYDINGAILWSTGAFTGDGTAVRKSSPIIINATTWKQVSFGDDHAGAIKTDGTLWMWGNNAYAQLGDNSTSGKFSPVQTASGGNNWALVSSGYYCSAAIKTDGTLWIWGQNYNGKLGTNDQIARSSPVQTVSATTNWKLVSCGGNITSAIKTDGTLWLWGQNNYGQLGRNDIVHRSSPIQTVSGGTNWKQVSSGTFHVGAIKTDGTLWLWGLNAGGLLGTNDSAYRSSPVQTISGGTNWSQVSCSKGVTGSTSNHTAAIKTDGTLWLWGNNDVGQIGTNSSSILSGVSSPVQTVSTGTNWQKVDTYFSSTAAIKTDGSLWVWGLNSLGGLGTNDTVNRSSPIQTVAGGRNWQDISLGKNALSAIASYADDASGSGIVTKEYLIDTYPSLVAQFKSAGLWLWGNGGTGRLGDNTTTSKSSPVQTIAGGNNWTSVTTSIASAGIKTDGSLWLWGEANNGGLGNNNSINSRSSPVQTAAAGTWKQVSLGATSGTSGGMGAAINTNGTLWTWGTSSNGNLGDNTTGSSRSSPVQTAALGTNWKQVSVGGMTVGAVKTDGTLWMWGFNSYGQLGRNDVISRSSPIQTIAGGTTWEQIDVGNYHTSAVKSDGTLWTWGRNGYGQLGTNDTTNRSSPVQTVVGGTNWKQVAAGGRVGTTTTGYTAAIKSDGTLWVWGWNAYGQLGIGSVTPKSSPVQTISGGTNWKFVAAGFYTTAAIKTDGSLWTWGRNNLGQLGTNDIVNYSSPVQTISGGYNWKTLDVGISQIISIRDDSSDPF